MKLINQKKTKMFLGADREELTKHINEFIEDKNVVDIKFGMDEGYLIIYEA
ncbi:MULTISPECIES: hypothetical protein [Lactobacillus]|uniref:hypothetical protein n=1 Tax=Lactobacillus TaxID=1578 RepID=UPI0013747CDA|nr:MULTISPECIES: hypothetical protein [Lactobacillus]